MTRSADTTGLPADALRTAMAAHREGRPDVAERTYLALAEADHPLKADLLYLAGTAACQQGRWAEGAERFRAAVALAPGRAHYHNNLGNALQQVGNLEEAISAYREAAVRDPALGEAHYNLGTALQLAGRPAEAADAYRSALIRMPSVPELYNNLGVALLAIGRGADAAGCFHQALNLRPDYAEAYNNLGNVHMAGGRIAEARSAYEQAIALAEDFADAHTNLGVALHRLGELDAAVEAQRVALIHKPDDVTARHRLRQTLGSIVPGWHFPMMNDAFRNQAYERAIKRAVGRLPGPDAQVLDIGTGSGLLSMMAARAGARRITTCETVRVIAEKAQEVIAANGYADRITVVPRLSSRLVVGADLPAKADLLVSEILSSDLLGEHVLSAMEHARQHLLARHAMIIPEAGHICGFLVGGEELELRSRVNEVAGFDISAFNEFAPLRLTLRRGRDPYPRLSEDFGIFGFDFVNTDFYPVERKTLSIPVTRSGVCQGVVQWIRLDLFEDITFENHPDLPNPASGWDHMVYCFQRPVPVRAGQTLRLIAEHDRLSPFLYLDGVE